MLQSMESQRVGHIFRCGIRVDFQHHPCGIPMIIVVGCPVVFIGTTVATVDGNCVESKVIGAVPIPKFAVRPSRRTFENLGCYGCSAHKVHEFLKFFHAGQVEIFGANLLGVIECVDKTVGKV